MRHTFFTMLVLGGLAFVPGPAAAQTDATRVEWRLDNLEQIGGHAVTIVGEPAVVDTDRGRAIQFDGVDDGLLIAPPEAIAAAHGPGWERARPADAAPSGRP